MSSLLNPISGEDADTSADMEVALKEDSKKLAWTYKIFLIGSGESGKSTYYKQIRSLFSQDMDVGIIKLCVQTLRENVRECIQRLVQFAEDDSFIATHGIDKFERLDSDLAEQLLNLAPGAKYTQTIATAIEKAWKSPIIQAVYKEAGINFWLLESCNYYLDHCSRFGEGFSPTAEDLLRARLKTTEKEQLDFFHPDDSWCNFLGITSAERDEMEEDIGPYWNVLDLGGVRSERRKWVPYLEGVHGVLFFVNSNGYRQVLFEDSSTLHIHEDMKLYESTLKTSFRKQPVFVLFTKDDLFSSNFSTEQFSAAFPDYKASEDTDEVKSARAYLEAGFVSLSPKERKHPVKFVWVSNFDIGQVKKSFVEMQQKILDAHNIKILKLCGLIEEVELDKSKKEEMNFSI